MGSKWWALSGHLLLFPVSGLYCNRSHRAVIMFTSQVLDTGVQRDRPVPSRNESSLSIP